MQRKTNKTRGPNAAEKVFHNWMKEQPCIISGEYGVELHHMYGSSFVHNKVLIGHWAVLPLHYDYHRGEMGIHTLGKKSWTQRFGRQCDRWEDVCLLYGFQPNKFGLYVPDEVYDAIMDWGR